MWPVDQHGSPPQTDPQDHPRHGQLGQRDLRAAGGIGVQRPLRLSAAADYHPLFCFNQFGDLERCLLRNGNVASADDWRSVVAPILARYRDVDIRCFFRGDAGFARPEVYEGLEGERYLYAIRLPANAVLYREIEPLLTRPVGRPPNKPVVRYHDFQYQAGSWGKPRRVVAKIEHHKGPDVHRDSRVSAFS